MQGNLQCSGVWQATRSRPRTSCSQKSILQTQEQISPRLHGPEIETVSGKEDLRCLWKAQSFHCPNRPHETFPLRQWKSGYNRCTSFTQLVVEVSTGILSSAMSSRSL